MLYYLNNFDSDYFLTGYIRHPIKFHSSRVTGLGSR